MFIALMIFFPVQMPIKEFRFRVPLFGLNCRVLCLLDMLGSFGVILGSFEIIWDHVRPFGGRISWKTLGTTKFNKIKKTEVSL